MLAFLFTTLAFFLSVSNVLAESDQGTTLPQCGNLTLSWTAGAAPYTITITDATSGISKTVVKKTNHLTWNINAPVFDRVSFTVKDFEGVTSGDGPYEIVYSGETSCHCSHVAKRDEDQNESRSEDDVVLARYLDLPATSYIGLSERLGSVWSKRHTAPRAHRRSLSSKPSVMAGRKLSPNAFCPGL